MPQISTSDFKTGMTLDLDDGLFTLSDFQHVKPGKGGAFVRTTLKNVRTGSVVDRTFRAGEKMERAIVDRKAMQLLYRDGSDFVFMDNQSYEQLNVPALTIADLAGFLADTATVELVFYGDEIIGVDLPAAVVLTVAETEPGMQGDRVSGAKKQATLSTGHVLQVPLFIEQGEDVKVDTRSGEFISRA